jgi:hypothetical protein
MNGNDTKQVGSLARFLSALVAVLLASMLVAANAAASPLTQPKADGWIGEQADGYLGLVREDAPAPIKLLVEQVNAKRKAGYMEIAKQQGVPLSEVEKVGGKTAIEKTLPGNYIRDTDGVWHKK